MENQNNNSGVNTVLIVIIIMILVAALVWFFDRPAPQQDNGGELKVDVNLPVDKNQGEGTQENY